MDARRSWDELAVAGEEQEKVAQLRAIVEASDPVAKEEDDLMLRRFLRARDLDLDKATAMFMNYLSWKKELMPGGFIADADVRNELSHDKAFMQGVDKYGRPVVVIFGGRHFPAKRDMDELKRFVPYCFNKICSRIPAGEEKFICICDLKGWTYSANCDIKGYIEGLNIMQNYYPERLDKVFLIHVPRLFMAAWKIIYPFIDKKTKKKFIFVEDRKLKATLLEEIEASQLPEMLGGKLPLIPINKAGRLS